MRFIILWLIAFALGDLAGYNRLINSVSNHRRRVFDRKQFGRRKNKTKMLPKFQILRYYMNRKAKNNRF